jgi:hypothetical protein
LKVKKTPVDNFNQQNISHAYSLQKSVKNLHLTEKTDKKTVREDWERIK